MKSEHKIRFIKENKIDVLTIIPYFSAFRLLRLIRVVDGDAFVSVYEGALRAAAMLSNVSKRIGVFFRTNNFHYVAGITLIVILLGAGGVSLVEAMPFKDALWWSIVTVTTVGYGDIVPKTGLGRIIASLSMMSGIGFIGLFYRNDL